MNFPSVLRGDILTQHWHALEEKHGWIHEHIWGHKELAFKSTVRFKIPQGKALRMTFGIAVDLLVKTFSLAWKIDQALWPPKKIVWFVISAVDCSVHFHVSLEVPGAEVSVRNCRSYYRLLVGDFRLGYLSIPNPVSREAITLSIFQNPTFGLLFYLCG